MLFPDHVSHILCYFKLYLIRKIVISIDELMMISMPNNRTRHSAWFPFVADSCPLRLTVLRSPNFLRKDGNLMTQNNQHNVSESNIVGPTFPFVRRPVVTCLLKRARYLLARSCFRSARGVLTAPFFGRFSNLFLIRIRILAQGSGPLSPSSSVLHTPCCRCLLSPCCGFPFATFLFALPL